MTNKEIYDRLGSEKGTLQREIMNAQFSLNGAWKDYGKASVFDDEKWDQVLEARQALLKAEAALEAWYQVEVEID
ncbi:MAG: hypothetical protein OXF23_04245 [Candidatus Dadabacteria bacterium]|nr:hypothetical protein [Candidatus Dadabacteria bacterium]